MATPARQKLTRAICFLLLGFGCERPERGPPPEHINATFFAGRDGPVALYAVRDATAGALDLAFELEPDRVSARDREGALVWSKATRAVEWTGGLDLDADGWPDLALVHAATVAPCGSSIVSDRWLEFVSGRDGGTLARWSAARDRCWTFPNTSYASTQWSQHSLLWGEGTRFISLQREYETSGSFVRFDSAQGALVDRYDYVFPSIAEYQEYTASATSAYGTSKWVPDSHVANGLVLPGAGGDQVVFFTSARLVIYAAVEYGAEQLLADVPFVARRDLAGRNYGLVAIDPNAEARLVLIAGTDAGTVLRDRLDDGRSVDVWGGIERHVTMIDLATRDHSQRFFSSAHDADDGHQYEGRVVYPDHPHVRRGAGAPSRVAFNVFTAGHWQLHITRPGGTDDERVLADVFLWDIADVEGDGVDEWLLSPAASYLPDWRTELRHWNEEALGLDLVTEYEGVPFLLTTFRRGRASTSRGELHPAAIVAGESGRAHLVLHQRDRSLALSP